jgi:hypothetical protein
LHHHGRLRDAQARATVLCWHGDPEPTIVPERLEKLLRKHMVLVVLEPVFVRKASTQLQDGITDVLLVCGEGKLHMEARDCRRSV